MELPFNSERVSLQTKHFQCCLFSAARPRVASPWVKSWNYPLTLKEFHCKPNTFSVVCSLLPDPGLLQPWVKSWNYPLTLKEFHCKPNTFSVVCSLLPDPGLLHPGLSHGITL